MPKPIRKQRLNINTRNKTGSTLMTLISEIMNKGRRNKKPMRKFKKLETTQEIGIISLGNTHCRNKGLLLTKQLHASPIVPAKNSQASIPERTKIVKFSVGALKTFVKIKLMLKAKTTGVMTAHHTPSREPEYLLRSCLTAIPHIVDLYENNPFNLCLKFLIETID